MRPRTLRFALGKAPQTVSALVAVLLALGFGLSGCSDDEGGGTPTFPVVGEDTAFVRLGHLSPDAGTVDVIVNEGQPSVVRADDVSFGEFSRYLQVPATFDGATLDVKVRTPTGDLAFETTVEILRGEVFTIAVVGRAAALSAAVVPSAFDTSNGEASVAFVHAAPDVPPVQVNLLNVSAPPLFPTTAFGAAAPVAVRIAPDAYSLQVRVAETGTVALTFDGVPVASGEAYTLWAVETPEGGLAAVVSIDDLTASSTASSTLSPASAGLRAVHASIEADALQVVVDGEVAAGFDALAYRTGTDALTLTAAEHRVQLFEASVDPDDPEAVALFDESLTLTPGSTTTLAAIGERNGVARPQVFTFGGETPAPGFGLVRLLHAASYTQPIKLVAIDGDGGETELASRANGEEISDFASLAAGTYTFAGRVVTAGDLQIFTVADVVVADGDVLNVYLVGDGFPPVPAGDDLTYFIDPEPTIDE